MPAPLLLGSLLGMISGAASAEVRDRIIDGLMIRNLSQSELGAVDRA